MEIVEDGRLMVDGTHVSFHPWEHEGMTKKDYLEWARKQAEGGVRLVVETLVDAYPEDVDSWIVSQVEYRDPDSGDLLGIYDLSSDDENPYTTQALVVERHLRNE